jgi:hypothetical protein
MKRIFDNAASERMLPWVFGATLPVLNLLAVNCVWPQLNSPDRVVELVGSVVTFAGVLIGFLATAKSLLFVLPRDSEVRRSSRSGELDLLLVGLLISIYLWFAVATIGLVLGFIASELSAVALLGCASVWLYFVGTASLQFVSAIRTLSRLLAAVTKSGG